MMLINELGPLGLEKGSWKIEGETLTLTPDPAAVADSVMGETLEAMSSAKKPYSLKISKEYDVIEFKESPLIGKLKRDVEN